MTIENYFSLSLLSVPLSHADIPPTIYQDMLTTILEKHIILILISDTWCPLLLQVI